MNRRMYKTTFQLCGSVVNFEVLHYRYLMKN